MLYHDIIAHRTMRYAAIPLLLTNLNDVHLACNTLRKQSLMEIILPCLDKVPCLAAQHHVRTVLIATCNRLKVSKEYQETRPESSALLLGTER